MKYRLSNCFCYIVKIIYNSSNPICQKLFKTKINFFLGYYLEIKKLFKKKNVFIKSTNRYHDHKQL